MSTAWKAVWREKRMRRMPWTWASAGPKASIYQRELLMGIPSPLAGLGPLRRNLVRELPDRARDDAPLELHHGGVLAPEAGADVLDRLLRFDHLTAGEDIHRRIAVLGPGVDGEMGLGDHHHPAHAEGAELMEGGIDDRRPARSGRPQHDIFHDVQLLEHVRLTTVKLNQQVLAQSVQL